MGTEAPWAPDLTPLQKKKQPRPIRKNDAQHRVQAGAGTPQKKKKKVGEKKGLQQQPPTTADNLDATTTPKETTLLWAKEKSRTQTNVVIRVGQRG